MNDFFYSFTDERILEPIKFTECECEIITVVDGYCTVKACETHTKSIREGTFTHVSPGISEPAFPVDKTDEFIGLHLAKIDLESQLESMKFQLSKEKSNYYSKLETDNSNLLDGSAMLESQVAKLKERFELEEDCHIATKELLNKYYSTLDEIKTFGLIEHLDVIEQSYQIICDDDGIKKTQKLKEILAKHEDKK